MHARLLLLTFALHVAPAVAHDSACPPTGDQLLRQMSDKLSGARSFSFTAKRAIDAALIGETAIAGDARIEAHVLRPNQLAAHARTNLGRRHFYADGRTLTVFDQKANTYAAVPMRTNIDGVVATLEAKYGFTPPLAEFAVSNPYQGLRAQAQSVSYVGREKLATGFLGLGGVECHRLALKGKVANAELWIGVADSLPRKLVATFHRAGHPQVRVAFSNWDLAAPANAAAFTFTPPPGAEKIEMYTPAQMAAARRNVAVVRKN